MLSTTVPVLWPAQQTQLPNNDLVDRMLIPFAVLVLARLQSAFRVGAPALCQKLATNLCEPSPGDAPDPLDVLSLLSVSGLEGLVDGQGEVRDSFAVGGVFQLRVGSGSPDKYDLVDTNFWYVLSLLSCFEIQNG